MFTEMLKSRKEQQRVGNLHQLRQEINQDWVLFKIQNFLERNSFLNFDIKAVQDEILQNDLFATFFIKDPAKQNISEKLIEELLKTPKEAASGKNCIRFDENGEICSKVGRETTKSVDFKKGKFYITQKYTEQSGGAQDNQYRDVIDFLLKASKQYYAAAIVDGDYYDNGKREELQKLFQNNEKVLIISIEDYLRRNDIFED